MSVTVFTDWAIKLLYNLQTGEGVAEKLEEQLILEVLASGGKVCDFLLLFGAVWWWYNVNQFGIVNRNNSWDILSWSQTQFFWICSFILFSYPFFSSSLWHIWVASKYPRKLGLFCCYLGCYIFELYFWLKNPAYPYFTLRGMV